MLLNISGLFYLRFGYAAIYRNVGIEEQNNYRYYKEKLTNVSLKVYYKKFIQRSYSSKIYTQTSIPKYYNILVTLQRYNQQSSSSQLYTH